MHPARKNCLLAAAPEKEFQAIEAALEPVSLPQGFQIVEPGGRIEHVYFPCNGIGSVLTFLSNSQRAEAGMFGREGFSPMTAIARSSISVHQVVMQTEGDAFRIPFDRLMAAIEEHTGLAGLLTRFMHVFSTQISYTALCNVSYHVTDRLARWLLMCHDRMSGDEIAITHDTIAMLLGVRRPSVTTAMHVLEGMKLVRAERGRLVIRNRGGLEEMAGRAYGIPEAEYRRLIGEF